MRAKRHSNRQFARSGDFESTVVRAAQVVIRQTNSPRAAWAEAFFRMAESGDDALMDLELPKKWDKSEWQW